MKSLILFCLLMVGCASAPLPPPAASELGFCQHPQPVPTCTDKLASLTEEDLKAGFTCPSNTRLVFPTTYTKSDKLLVMCQCK